MDLSNNKLGKKGVYVLIEALKRHKSLTTLKIGNNKIESDGANSIFQALKINSTLTFLDLSNNKIGDRAVLTLNSIMLLVNHFNFSIFFFKTIFLKIETFLSSYSCTN